VELIPGSGVFVSGLFYAGCQEEPTVDGSELVSKLVTEVFSDEEILVSGSCMGKKTRSKCKTLEWQKICAIRGISVLIRLLM